MEFLIGGKDRALLLHGSGGRTQIGAVDLFFFENLVTYGNKIGARILAKFN